MVFFYFVVFVSVHDCLLKVMTLKEFAVCIV